MVMIFGLKWKATLFMLNCCSYFLGNFWKKLGYFFISHLVTLVPIVECFYKVDHQRRKTKADNFTAWVPEANFLVVPFTRSKPNTVVSCNQNLRCEELLNFAQRKIAILKRANPGLFSFIFVLFKHKFYRKNCSLKQDSNSDRQSRILHFACFELCEWM